jgi:hypothetical protein
VNVNSDNSMGDVGLKSVSKSVSSLERMEAIYLRKNNFGLQEIQNFLENISLPSLGTLWLDGDSTGEEIPQQSDQLSQLLIKYTNIESLRVFDWGPAQSLATGA